MSDKVVTRFAPSPTGYLHVGGARTALFNWLAARHFGGTFILRIEDTDQKRNTPTAVRQVIEDLKRLNLIWHEGPEAGGPNGPYLQSERRDIYDKYLKRLIEQGRAYYCFDTPEELEARRRAAQEAKQGFIYRRPKVLPDESDVKKARDKGLPVTVRLIMPEQGEIEVKDIVRGSVKFGAGELGDFIIQKSDGFPTYHFACVVDDELMGVTHVIRGQEHLMNTPYHQVLQEALGFRTPEYAHMSVTVSEGGGKLSKRERPKTLKRELKQVQGLDAAKLAGDIGVDESIIDGFVNGKQTPDMPVVDKIAEHFGIHLPEINLVDFFRSGYVPEAMMNFLALLGWNPGGDREIMTEKELIELFDPARLTKSNSLFDRRKLLSFNTEHIKMLDEQTLAGHFRVYLRETGSVVDNADDEMLRRLVRINEGARTLEQIEAKCRFIFAENDKLEYDPRAVKKVLRKEGAEEILSEIRQRLLDMESIDPEGLEKMLRGLAEEKQVGLGKVAQPLRVAITGTTVSPPIFDSIDILGLDNTLKRIDITLAKFGGGN